MIFVAVGTHPAQFDRLIRRLDEIAPKIKDKIIVQRGFTRYKPKNLDYFDFTDEIDEYYKKAKVIIVQSATSLLEVCLKYDKPVITVPRQKKFKEHINDHQVEFADYFSEKTSIKAIMDINDLTPELINGYKKKASLSKKGLIKLQTYIKEIIGDA